MVQIAGYLKTSLIEWPGKIAAVIFVPGCNFRCPFCHNSDLSDPQKQPKLTFFEEGEIFADLKKRQKWVDAVVVTGGEPTLQPELAGFLKKLKKMGFLTMIETNGSKPETITRLLKDGLIDFVAMDYKGNFDNYQNFINVKCQMLNVKSSMELILKSGIGCEFRTTVVPGLHNEKILIQMAGEIRSLIENCKLKIVNYHWVLQNFRPTNCLDLRFSELKPFTPGELKEYLKTAQKIVLQTEIRGE